MSPNESNQIFATISDRKFYRLLDRMDGYSIQNPEYKPTMLPNKNSELYKEAEKMWNENRDIIFSEGDSTEKNDGLDEENTSLDVVQVSRDDEIKGLFELIDFVENKNNLSISFDCILDEDVNVSTVDLGKTKRKILTRSNSNALLKEKRSVIKSRTKSNPADRNAYAATENRVTDIDGMIETLTNKRKDAAIKALKYFVSYMKTKNDCTIFIDCSKQKYLIFRNATLKKLYEKMSVKFK